MMDHEASDESLRSGDAPALLELLRQLAEARSPEELRVGLAQLRQQLAEPDSTLLWGDDRTSVPMAPAALSAALDQIGVSQTLQRACYYIDRLIKSITEVRTSQINDINLNRWKEYDDILTDSLWQLERRDSSGAHSASYWGNFIPQIPNQMLRRYTRPGEWVLDTFAGSGTTMLEAQRLGRNSLGVELQPAVAADARQRVAAEPNTYGVVSEIVAGDSAAIEYRQLLERHGQRSVQLVLMHPPYFDIIPFSEDPRDLSTAASVESFLEMMGQVIEGAAAVLDRGRYLALVIGDTYRNGEWLPLGFQSMNALLQRGFSLKSIVVKNFEQTTAKRAQKELWRYRALAGGFYIFKHEYIFVCQKQH